MFLSSYFINNSVLLVFVQSGITSDNITGKVGYVMNKYALNKGVTIRSLVLGLTPSTVDEFLVELNRRKETDNRVSQTKIKFESLVSECGWNSQNEFLVAIGYGKDIPPVRRRHLKHVDFPVHFTVDELATHLGVKGPAARYLVKKGLKCSVIKFIGKKPYGRCVYQRLDAKNPLVLERFKNTVVLSPAVADEIKNSMTDLNAA